jgi:hypothetical protein
MFINKHLKHYKITKKYLDLLQFPNFRQYFIYINKRKICQLLQD